MVATTFRTGGHDRAFLFRKKPGLGRAGGGDKGWFNLIFLAGNFRKKLKVMISPIYTKARAENEFLNSNISKIVLRRGANLSSRRLSRIRCQTNID